MNQKTTFGNRIRQTEINGKEFQIFLLNASDGITMARDLSTTLLPVLGTLKTKDDGQVDFRAAAVELSQNIDKIDILSVLNKLLKELCVDQDEVSFDDFFAGNYGELIDIVAYALRENFESFFSQSGTFQNLMKG